MQTRAADYFRQVVKAVKHCHRRNVYHGDLKPENCLLQNDVIKLADFGSASLHKWSRKAAGSVFYSAPEVLPLFFSHSDRTPLPEGVRALLDQSSEEDLNIDTSGAPYDAAASDVWSLGILLFVMLCGRPPFAEASYYDVNFARLARGRYRFPRAFSKPVVRLLRRILQVKPTDRCSLADILRDPFVTPLPTTKLSSALQLRMARSNRIVEAAASFDPSGWCFQC